MVVIFTLFSDDMAVILAGFFVKYLEVDRVDTLFEADNDAIVGSDAGKHDVLVVTERADG